MRGGGGGGLFFFFKQKTAYEITRCLEFRRVLFRSSITGTSRTNGATEILIGGDGNDTLRGSSGDDLLQGGADNDSLFGENDNDTLEGGAGDDTLEGGNGDDSIDGGTGGETTGDVLTVGGPRDRFALIDGGAGAIVVVDVTGSLGRDTVTNVEILRFSDGDVATAGLALGQEVVGTNPAGELLSGTANDDLITGLQGNDTITGLDGSDIINGGDGHDVLRGGTGADDFIFDTALSAGNVDRIIDFETGMDQIMIDSGVFVGLADGLLNSTAFHINGTGLAEAGLHPIIFDTTTNTLYFDADGTGTAEGQAFATLTSVTSLDASDFFIF